MAHLRNTFGASVVVGLLIAAGCGSSGGGGDFAQNGDDGGSDSGPGSFGDSGDNGDGSGPCVNLQCKQVACPSGGTTSLTGKVYDPSGNEVLYNAVVYVPNESVAPFTDGVTCDNCATPLSGSPIATALTDATGSFTLKNVPVGVDIPLVVQIGRWRRQVTIPAVDACTTTPVDAGITRLPRNKSEGDIPKIAITTGGADSLECFLRKLGIDDSEITNPNGDGRVHLYQGRNSGGSGNGSLINSATPPATALWNDLPTLEKYDMVILSCEGSENTATKSTVARENLRDYLNVGGRVFASHYHYVWFQQGAAPLPTTANWNLTTSSANVDVSVDTSFVKGQALSDWLDANGASKSPGVVSMTAIKTNVTSVPATGAPADESTRWLYQPNQQISTKPTVTADATKFFSFNTPIGTPADQQCGRGVYTDIHVSGTPTAADSKFPDLCDSKALSPQEKALLFLMMDLSSCVQDDTKPPEPPPVVK